MASFIQIGDIINAARLAWQVYQFGWSSDLAASRQYIEFGNDIRGLATNLDSVGRVVNNALNEMNNRNLPLCRPWDLSSLREIVGDYETTLRDSKALLEENKQYGTPRGHMANVEFNVLVQPKAQRLQERILLHNSKMLLLLQPLEMDLLTRVHKDLAQRIGDVHNDLRKLMGAVIPNYEQARDQMETQESCILEIPSDIANKFERAAEIGRIHSIAPASFPLDESTSAFVVHLQQSTVLFQAGIFVDQRQPPPQQYLNLLKCVWLMRWMRVSPKLADPSNQSHWPSYIKKLDQELSRECFRFTAGSSNQLIPPLLDGLRPEMFEIWQQPLDQSLLSTSHEPEFLMEDIMEAPLASTTSSVTQAIRLQRVVNSASERYILLETAVDAASGKIEKGKLDFNLRLSTFIPIYAVPSVQAGPLNMILQTESQRTSQFTFADMDGLLKFQRALTGFKLWKSYSQPNTQVSFVLSTQKKPVIEHAYIQLWVASPLEGKLATPANEEIEERETTSITTPPITKALSARNDSFTSNNSTMERLQSDNLFGSFSLSDLNLGSSLPNTPSRANHAMTRDSDATRLSPTRRTARMATAPIMQSRRGTTITVTSNSSRSSDRTVTDIDTGTGGGVLHRKPLRPMVVIFSKAKDAAGTLSITTIQLDDGTAVNPERCNCRKASSSCNITAIEQAKGEKSLMAQRYEAQQGYFDWDIARLGVTRRKELPDAAWSKLKRVSITFVDHRQRDQFGGSMCRCKIVTNGERKSCIESGHKGLFGEVKQVGNRQLRAYHEAHEHRQDIVIGQAPDHNGSKIR
ncbi:hypothetical protein BDY21DRAFT_286239 [Lineolata rhizophorae]|uniref:Uncharacterized protein n=1 Tax=Lineolata rhizophorae TaxID=578093 RepID=A0A6A6P0I4_9PEZI|nr:hypothetical protein BDY21DRAFT_286239 [Lineolata rhizophorae]